MINFLSGFFALIDRAVLIIFFKSNRGLGGYVCFLLFQGQYLRLQTQRGGHRFCARQLKIIFLRTAGVIQLLLKLFNLLV